MLRKMLFHYGYEHLQEVMDEFGLSAVDALRWLTEMYMEEIAPVEA